MNNNEIIDGFIKSWSKTILESMGDNISFEEILVNKLGSNTNRGYQPIIDMIKFHQKVDVIDENLLEFTMISKDDDEAIFRTLERFGDDIDKINNKLIQYGLEIDPNDNEEYNSMHDSNVGNIVEIRKTANINVIDYDKCVKFVDSII